MKLPYFLRVAALGCTLLGLAGCAKFLDINTNPNTPDRSSVPADAYLPSAQRGIGLLLNQGLNTLGNNYTGVWVNSSGLSPAQSVRYTITASDFEATWNLAYAEILEDLRGVEEAGVASNSPNAQAIAKILRAFVFQILVDSWGSVPYFEANKGPAILTPKYDSGKSVYDANIAALQSAINQAGTGLDGTLSSNDIICRGNMDLWVRIARTLRLRYLMRQISNDASVASLITQAISDGNIAPVGRKFLGELPSDIAVTIQPGYLLTAGKLNPLYEAQGFDAGGNPTQNWALGVRANEYAVDTLRKTFDPRINILWRRTATAVDSNFDLPLSPIPAQGPLRGGYRGWSQGPQGPSSVYSGPGILSQVGLNVVGNLSDPASTTRGTVIMTAAESHFLLAEAAARALGVISNFGYVQGVQASFSWLYSFNGGINPRTGASAASDAGAYLLGSGALPGTQMAQIAQIIYQKWVTLQGTNGAEIWAEWRRTGYPANLRLSGIANFSNFPTRVVYVTTERAANGPNVPANDDYITQRIFWQPALITPLPAKTGLGR
jgi:Starch-binding associating with outer membrane